MKGLLAACSLALFATVCAAQPYPSRPITLVVPATPGSGPDVVARTFGQKLSQRIGQPVVVDNKPGASGNIGAALVAKAPPDGYTLMVTINNFVITPALYKDLPYDPVEDFTTISRLAVGNLALVANPKVLPVHTLKELTARSHANPGKLNYPLATARRSTWQSSC
jgi:tripartite-type tricarboxylate transporter receptor subunit TctC